MKPTNCRRQVNRTTIHEKGKWHTETVSQCSGYSYGRISDSTGIGKFSYEGENPMRAYLIASGICIVKYVFYAAAAVAIPIAVKWGMKKLGISKDNDALLPIPNNNPLPPLPTNEPTEGKLDKDVNRAANESAPIYLMTTEITAGSRIIVFSSPGVGKTVVSYQMSYAIRSGLKSGLFPDEVESEPQEVLLIDTEQEDDDLFLRYANGANLIPNGITRVSDCNFNTAEEVSSYVWKKVSGWETNGTVIIDNITSAFSLQSPEKIRAFYGQLRAIQGEMKKKGIKITYILVCHETKSSKKLTLKSLQGSGNLGNFATAVYGLERAEGEDMVKFKVLKNRRSKNNGSAYLEKLCTEPYFHFEFQGIVDEPESTEAPTVDAISSSVEIAPSVRKVIDENFKVQLLEEHEHDKKSYAVLWDKYVNLYDLPTDKYKGKNKVRNLIVEARKLAKAKDCQPM